VGHENIFKGKNETSAEIIIPSCTQVHIIFEPRFTNKDPSIRYFKINPFLKLKIKNSKWTKNLQQKYIQ